MTTPSEPGRSVFGDDRKELEESDESGPRSAVGCGELGRARSPAFEGASELGNLTRFGRSAISRLVICSGGRWSRTRRLGIGTPNPAGAPQFIGIKVPEND